jgi:hypothetical protein
MGRFETQWLAASANLSALADLSGQWIETVHGRPPKGILLDMDSSVSPTHCEQENSMWNGHYDCTRYHPLFVFNQFGDLERCALRPGNVHSADGWENVLKPVVARYRGKVSRIYFRADAGFANPDIYEYLEAERALRLVPDGRGCYTAQRLRRHLAHDRGTSAATNQVNGVVSSIVTRLDETSGKVCLYDGKFRISPALQTERASGQRSKAAGVVIGSSKFASWDSLGLVLASIWRISVDIK